MMAIDARRRSVYIHVHFTELALKIWITGKCGLTVESMMFIMMLILTKIRPVKYIFELVFIYQDNCISNCSRHQHFCYKVIDPEPINCVFWSAQKQKIVTQICQMTSQK